MSDPSLVTSGMSQHTTIGGQEIRIEIFKLDREQTWTLELIDQAGTSVVWDDQFANEQDALDEAKRNLKEEGLSLFRESGTVISFPPKRK